MFVVNNKNKKANVEPGTNKLVLLGRPAEHADTTPARLLKEANTKIFPKQEEPNTAAGDTAFKIY